jgi:CDP-diacylglycerol---serine O-phosphatidyltransferase
MEMQKNSVNPIPNIITGLNLISGCIAISMAIQDNYTAAAYLIILSAVLDFFDGLMAKALNATSDFGKMFDSITDIVSFGVAPSVLMFKIMVMSLTFNDSTFNLESADFTENIFFLSSFLLTLFAAIRLARFTANNNETDSFKGMPTPASALLVASISLIVTSNETLQYFIFNNTRLLIFIICISILMVINLPMMKMKFQGSKVKDNFMKYLFILGSIILLLIFQIAGLPLVILLYIVISIVNTLIKEPNL